ncbi:MAG: hypothetical protein IKV39_03030 [Clostridia bacterium]|nr:hypothetical protein [Clostridia bacterium]
MKKIITLIMVAVLMISFAVMVNAATGTVVYATKVDEAPNMEEDTPFIDETWGEPAIVLNANSENVEFFKQFTEDNQFIKDSYWEANKAMLSLIEPDAGDVEIYYLWDSKYLYFGMKTPDTTPSGHVEAYKGDGFQMWISPLAAINQNYVQSKIHEENPLDEFYDANESLYDFYASLDASDWDSIAGGAAAACDFEVYIHDDGYMYAYVRIPLVNIGLNAKSNLHGIELATALLRVSSKSVEDRGYAGYLTWGKYFYETKLDTLNTVVLVDPAQGEVTVDTTPVETTAPETTAPETTAPETTAPETTAPETTAPETTAPETTVPETTAPETTAPETTAPETSAPTTPAEPAAEKNNTGLIIGIVAAVVVVGAVVGIVLGKKKK